MMASVDHTRMPGSIRTPRLDELELLRAIEWAAGGLFRDVGMDDIAEHEPTAPEELAGYVALGRAWVVCHDDVPVAYALVDVVDGHAHLEQLSVRPENGRRGFGAALLDHVCRQSRDNGFVAVTLTTFR